MKSMKSMKNTMTPLEFEGIVSFGGEIYAIEDTIGGGALRRGSPYVPSLLPLKDGRLLLTSADFKGGNFDGVSDAGTYGITSADLGKTWSDPVALRTMGGGYVRGGHSSLLRLQSGALGLIDWDTFYRSQDEGETWSEPVVIGERKWGHHVRNDCAIVLSSGRIVAPAYMYPKTVDDMCTESTDELAFGIAHHSDDEGNTWQESETLIVVPLDGGRRGLYAWDEWSVLELEDGRLLGMGRTCLNRLFQCFSEDAGKTWGKIEPTCLSTDGSPCLLRRIPATGDLLVIWTQTSAEEFQQYLTRHRLTCAVSRDEGKTWQNYRNLESLDDVTQVEPAELKRYQVDPKYTGYHQPEDRQRYHRAPGVLRVGYPTCTFLDDRAIITYGYGCADDPIGYVACKIRVVPTTWFYDC
jgi:sialidase-1